MKPAIFIDLDFDAAWDRARAEGVALLIAVTKGGDAACRTMDETTWVDPKVVDRIAKAAIAIQLDVEGSDVERWGAKQLGVTSTPTLVAYDNGGEIARVAGAMDAPDLLGWLDGIALGETVVERRRREVAANPKDTVRRMQLADALMNAGALDEATTEYARLWTHMLEDGPKWEGIKHSSFVHTLKRLVQRHPPAREVFAALQAASPPSLDAPDPVAFSEWWALNDALGQNAQTLAWFDEHGERALAIPALAPRLVEQLEPILVAADRWADVAKLYPRPLVKIRDLVTLRAGVLAELAAIAAVAPPGQLAEGMDFTRKGVDQQLRETAYKLVRALRAAGREDDAKMIAAVAVDADGSPEMADAVRPG